MKNYKIFVGHVAVDSGMIWVGDPCYILQDTGDNMKEKVLGKDWTEFCNRLERMESFRNFNFSKGHDGFGIVTESGYGDGIYPVYATMENDRVKKLEIEFF